MPPEHLLPDRLAAVLAVVYLIFNEGYGGRTDLADEAIRLGRALAELMPDEPEVHGLLALMLLHDARRDARFRDGELVLLDDQDRALWDRGRDRRGPRAARPRDRAARPRARTCSRPRSRRCTPSDAARLGARSPRSTASWPSSPARRWSSSTAPSPWPRPTAPAAGLALVDGLDLDDYPVPALDPGRPAAPARPHRRGPRSPTSARSSWPRPIPSGGSWRAAASSRSSGDGHPRSPDPPSAAGEGLCDARYRDPLDVRALRRVAHVSPAHFSREFRRAFGETPHQYLLTRRLERAAALLRNTDRSVAEICLTVGLRSVGSFTTSFGRAYGMAPTAYRAAYPPAATHARVPDLRAARVVATAAQQFWRRQPR